MNTYHNKSTHFSFIAIAMWELCVFPWALHALHQSETSAEIPQDPLTVFNLYHHNSIRVGTLQQAGERFFTATWDDIKNWSYRVIEKGQ